MSEQRRMPLTAPGRALMRGWHHADGCPSNERLGKVGMEDECECAFLGFIRTVERSATTDLDLDALADALYGLRPAHLAVAFWPDAVQLAGAYRRVIEGDEPLLHVTPMDEAEGWACRWPDKRYGRENRARRA